MLKIWLGIAPTIIIQTWFDNVFIDLSTNILCRS